DVVYDYTPSQDGELDIELDHDEGWVSLYVFKDCLFESTLSYHTSTNGTSRSISGLPVEAGETYYIIVSDWDTESMNSTLELDGPPVGDLEDCEEAVAGDTEDISICAGIEFSLFTEGVSTAEAGLSYQWEESEDGENWTEIEEATGKNYTVSEGVEETTFYRLVVSCEFGDSDASDPIEVSINDPEDCYCTPEGANNNSNEIRNFSLSNIDNDSDASEGENGYSDYTDSVAPAELEVEEVYTASLTSGSGTGNHGAAIWIDYNDNGIFEEDEMVAF